VGRPDYLSPAFKSPAKDTANRLYKFNQYNPKSIVCYASYNPSFLFVVVIKIKIVIMGEI